MTSDSFINLSKVKSMLTNVVTSGNTESRIDQGTGTAPFVEDPPSSSASSQTINVVLFGETGVGKSSVINLIARKDVARVSSDVDGCTMQSTRYDIPFDNMNFAIFDTVGLEEPQMGVNGYLKAIEKAYELILKLSAAGGIHLLLFCMRGGRITATTQSNYRLFCECLCSTRVPIALVFTGLERETEMEHWWMRNETYIKQYGIKSDGHACVTAVRDDAPGDDMKYEESQETIRELLKTCALKNEAFSLESRSWFTKLGMGMRRLIERGANPRKKDVLKVLTRRCKIDPETAKKIAEMMEKGDEEIRNENQDEQAGDGGGGRGSNPDMIADLEGGREVSREGGMEDDALSNQQDDVRAKPLANERKVKGRARFNRGDNNKTRARDDKAERKAEGIPKRKDHAPSSQPGDVKVVPRTDGTKVDMNAAKGNALLNLVSGGSTRSTGARGHQSLSIPGR